MRQRSRGSASVEILVVAPILILLFCGAIHVHRRALAEQEALALARGCAFSYALAGCPEDPRRLALCRGSEVGRAGELDGKSAARGAQRAHSLLDQVSDWWLIGDLLRGLFGTGSRAVAQRPYRAFASNESRSASGKVYLVCNTLAEPWADRLRAVACGVAEKVHVADSLRRLKVCP